MSTKNILWLGVILIIIIAGFIFWNQDSETNYNKQEVPAPINEVIDTEATSDTTPPEVTNDDMEELKPMSTIGQSAGGNAITAYHFGTGEDELLFIGGIHGGYSWNTALLGFELVDWFKANEAKIPTNVRVTVIPVLNPDGLEKVTGKTERFTSADVNKADAVLVSGRFNENNVDLNRNFACEWKAEGTWQNRTVSGGTAAFSEPEAQAIRNYVNQKEPTAAITWYSAAGGVYASNCNNGVGEQTLALTNLFAQASSYTAHEEFNYYEITGDMVNWFASQNIPAISVLLSDHERTELTKNLAGVEAVLEFYAN